MNRAAEVWQPCSLISVKTYAAIIIRGQSSCAFSILLERGMDGHTIPRYRFSSLYDVI